MSLTLFAAPKAVEGHIGLIQNNALRSWKALSPVPQIILLGDDDGIAGMARQHDVEHLADIESNRWGTPKVRSIFDQARAKAKHDIVCYVNADIVLSSRLLLAMDRVRQSFEQFLLIGCRWDLDVTQELRFEGDDAFEVLWRRALDSGGRHAPTGIDYFVFPKDLYRAIPQFALGRTVWDQWLVGSALMRGVPVVDASEAAPVIHQNHGYKDARSADQVWASEEAQWNLFYAGGYGACCDISDATHRLTSDFALEEVPSSVSRARRRSKRWLERMYVRLVGRPRQLRQSSVGTGD